MRTGLAALMGILGLLVSNALAHDCWLFPEDGSPVPGDTLVVRQRWGHDLKVDLELALDEELTERFEWITDDGVTDLLRTERGPVHPRLSPLLEWPVGSEGLALLLMDHREQTIALSAQEFRQHLQLEKFDHLLSRVDEGTQRERYVRSLKALIPVGTSSGNVFGATFGQKLELVLLGNPYELSPGDTLGVRLLLDGKGLNEHWVWALNQGGGDLLKTSSRTDSSGIARFPLSQRGFWLIRAVHLRPVGEDDTSEWLGSWATFTFHLE